MPFYFPNSYRPSRSPSRDRAPRRSQDSGAAPLVSRDYNRNHDRDSYHPSQHDLQHRQDSASTRGPDTSAAPRCNIIPQDQSYGMDPHKSSAELANALRQLYDLLTKKLQLTIRRDVEMKTMRKREEDYQRNVAAAKNFPVVEDAFQMFKNHRKEQLDPIEKELKEVAKQYQTVIDNLAHALVTALPINEIKARQIVGAAKARLFLESESSQITQDEKLRNLEKSVSELKNAHEELKDARENLTSDLAKFKKENERLREGQSKALDAWAQQREQLRADNESLRAEFTAIKVDFATQLNAMRDEFSKSLEELKCQRNADDTQIVSNPVKDETAGHEKVALAQMAGKLSEEIAILQRDTTDHEALLDRIDIDSLDEAIAKLSQYPEFTDLNGQIICQKAESERLVRDIKQNTEAHYARLLQGFSEKIILYCAKSLDGLSARVKALEDANPSTSIPLGVEDAVSRVLAQTSAHWTKLASEIRDISHRLATGESRVTAVEATVTATEEKTSHLQEKNRALDQNLGAFQGKMVAQFGALEMIVQNLSSQWNNMSTVQMAQIILTHLSRLQPGQAIPGLQHIHERLSDLEKIVQETREQRRAFSVGIQSVCNDISKAPKRSLVMDETVPGQLVKRPRSGGINNTNEGHLDS